MEEAVEPSLINWENLGLSKQARCCRITFASIIALVLLLATTLFILYAKVKENELKLDKIVCSSTVQITEAEAVENYSKDDDEEYQ